MSNSGMIFITTKSAAQPCDRNQDKPGHEEREGDTKDTKKISLNKQEID
jgi:hypothetical protein